jgi:NAD(P)-dependent dehydrogenase (short-subunit alcohol dehydrogenase family)
LGSSANALIPAVDRSEYSISHAAASMIASLFAVRRVASGIGVQEIRPGVIRTDMAALVAERDTACGAAGFWPVYHWGEAKDLERAIAALAAGDRHSRPAIPSTSTAGCICSSFERAAPRGDRGWARL